MANGYLLLVHGDQLTLNGIIVASVLAVIAIAVPIVVYLRQRSIRSVDYDIVSDVRLIDSDAAESFGDLLQVSYRQRRLRQARIVDVRVMNTGNTYVAAADYNKPIVFELKGGQAPIDARVIAESQDGITGDIFEVQANGARTVSITPPLLNKGQWFTLRMLFDDAKSEVTGTHHIAGSIAMREYSRSMHASDQRFTNYALLIFFAAIAGTVVVSMAVYHTNAAEALVAAGVATSLVAIPWLIIAGILDVRRRRP